MPRTIRDVALLINPTAGRGRGTHHVDQVVPVLEAAGWNVRRLQGVDGAEAESLAAKAVADGVDALVVLGGDGLVHAAIQAIAGTEVVLGVIPAGTGNDFARTIGLPRGDVVAAARHLVAARPQRIDLARAGDRWFATVLAAGFDAVVNERANAMTWPRGQMRYNLATIAELRVLRARPYVLTLDGVEQQLDAVLVAVGNGPSFGGGLRITEGAEIDDGLLDVVVIKPITRRELLTTYPKLFKGTHISHPQYERHRVRQVTVAAPGIIAYADGERFGALPLTVECVAAAAWVLA
ncbi:diacylglycerol/lipid kinase family protein [Nocardioides montaniterrae]